MAGRLRPQRTLILGGDSGIALGQDPPEVEVVPLASSPGESSHLVARRFWGTAPEVVAAATEDSEAVLLGAALAAHLGEPLLLVDRDEVPALARRARDLQAGRVLAVRTEGHAAAGWFKPDCPIEVLDRAAVESRIVARLGPERIRNVVLLRTPEERKIGQTSWLAPFLSLARGAPLVLCGSADALEAERRVERFLQHHKLRPRTLTILADYDTIGTAAAPIRRTATSGAPQGDVATEPCVPRTLDQTATLGVGRIPLSSLADASLLLARGLLRERFPAGAVTRAVVVANPVQDGRPLPLCEAISRLTAEELKNFHLSVDEFYHRPANSPEVVAAARAADLILYEGHVEDQDLFIPRASAPQPEETAGPLEGLPVVVLQNCDSLQHGAWRQVYRRGGVAVVGTSTPVHSTSGSSLVKAMIDAALYRGATLGEALADAQNYFYCLQDLKDARGHQEQAKSHRAVLSFRLLGDPELKWFPRNLGSPALGPAVARWRSADRLAITLPGARFPEVRTDRYVARIAPGSETAGMVKRLPSDRTRNTAVPAPTPAGEATGLEAAGAPGARPPVPVRSLTPLCFFRLPAPAGFPADAKGKAGVAEENGPRAVFRVDRVGQWIYVLYYPADPRLGSSVTLNFREAKP